MRIKNLLLNIKMACYSCSAEFGLLTKETGCEVCGFAFCSRCCKKQQVPSESGENKKLICNKCFKELTGGEPRSTSRGSPPLAHKSKHGVVKKTVI
ncbi:zinc finger FYVE domain-containing protein 19 [Caerostris extrusa]|uniref:Zinc finger FYVE domain-containing protein 19 n=1 Tax=Caerostris extrusa TaxID=172846 RepID=A0AAV4SEG7_CAEEX|nr:zinc finger FYVE domain-containing protein 19 [Caerostris extrusa]